ncbi:MAG: ferritin [Candidatus Omnitrophota bacterium]|jgi:ferritin
MISKNIADKIIYQINREIYSGYLYLGMAFYAHSIGLKGFASWFKCQFREELEHAERMYDFLLEKGARVLLDEIEAPVQDYQCAQELFEKTLAHEIAVTGMIKCLFDAAKKEGDEDTIRLISWFVKEQVEEEATPASILKRIKEAKNDAKALAVIDSALLNRK